MAPSVLRRSGIRMHWNCVDLMGIPTRSVFLYPHLGALVSIRTRLPVLFPVSVPIPDPLRQLGQLPNVRLRLGDLPLEVVAIVGHLALLPAQVVERCGVGLDGGHHAHDAFGAGVVEELGAEVPDEVLEGQGAAVGRLVYVQLDLSGGR